MSFAKDRGRARLGAAFMIAGGLLVLFALSLFLYNDAEDRRASASATRIADALEARIETRIEADAGGAVYARDPAKTISVDGETYIGLLRIPALELSLPVMREWNYRKLKISPCRYSGSTEEDTMVIAAHNYRRHFGSIRLLSRGSAVYFTDADGNTNSYAVAAVETLEATDIEGMTSSGYALTLFTCTYGGAARVAVRCDRVESLSETGI
ncbi:MAG: sortase [Clostridiales Family XIII bacterium]|jgi:sortase A|nr:sortase [Clostridiales Family XIII bacterium]